MAASSFACRLEEGERAICRKTFYMLYYNIKRAETHNPQSLKIE